MPVLNEADNVKLGALQASRVYLGEYFIWPVIPVSVVVTGFEIKIELEDNLSGWFDPDEGDPDDGTKWHQVVASGGSWTPVEPGQEDWTPVNPMKV